MRDKDELKLFSTETLEEILKRKETLPRFSDDHRYGFRFNDLRQELIRRKEERQHEK